jgi:hypothetical protein
VPLGTFDAWLKDRICRMADADSRREQAVAERSSQFVRLLTACTIVRLYVTAFATVRSDKKDSSRVKQAQAALQHLEVRPPRCRRCCVAAA